MQTVLQQIINALSLGSIYALLALGYSMVYGIINLINFAHGDIYMSYFVGSNARSFPQVIEQVNYVFGGVQISNIQILILVTALILMVSLQLIIKKTKMGRAMRAVSVDPAAAELVGVNVNHTISFTFALGSALAGAAGVLIGMYYNQIDPLMGMTPGIKAFVAAVLGGIGSVPGASLGGFLIGILETFFQSIGLSAYKDAVVYLVLIVILLFLPAGIFGKNAKEKV